MQQGKQATKVRCVLVCCCCRVWLHTAADQDAVISASDCVERSRQRLQLRKRQTRVAGRERGRLRGHRAAGPQPTLIDTSESPVLSQASWSARGIGLSSTSSNSSTCWSETGVPRLVREAQSWLEGEKLCEMDRTD